MAWTKYAGASGSPVTTTSQEDTKTIPVMPSELLEGARPVAISQRLPPWWVSSGSLVVNVFASMAEVEGLDQGTDRHTFEPLDMSHICQLSGACPGWDLQKFICFCPMVFFLVHSTSVQGFPVSPTSF